MVLLDGREVDRMDRNMAKLLAKSDEQDRDTVRTGEVNGVDGNTVALLVELDRDTVRTGERWEGMDGTQAALVAGWERGGWVEWEHGCATGGESGAG